MIDLNKPDSPEQEKTEIEILKAKLKKAKRIIKNKNNYIANLKGYYDRKLSIQRAEILFDNFLTLICAILLTLVVFNVSEHESAKVSGSHEVIQIQKPVPENNTNTGDKVVSSNSQNLMQVAGEKSAYLTADDIKDDIIFKAMELDNLSDKSKLINQTPDHQVLSYISNIIEKQLGN